MHKPVAWILSAYRADSHAIWAEWLTGHFSHIDWRLYELPGRHFRWRIRGNPLSWLDTLPDEAPDLIIATSMVDIATIKGLKPCLANTPVYYYFHENQFAYPLSEKQIHSVEPQMVQLYGALAADRLYFNSQYNLTTFLDGVDKLLNRMPDALPEPIRNRLSRKSQVLPVPVDPISPAKHKSEKLIVWNHRWEYDKNPELFSRAMLQLSEKISDFELALLGARPDVSPEPLRRLTDTLPRHIIANGKLQRADYEAVLARAAIVVSTSLHEFQGFSILEAVSAGAVPLVPDDLCYREQYPAHCRYPAGDCEALVNRLSAWLKTALPEKIDMADRYTTIASQAWATQLDDYFK